MQFHEKLNEYIETLDCTAKDISDISGLSETTLSRYRSGERTPKKDSDAFEQICTAIVTIAKNKNRTDIIEETVKDSFLNCSNTAEIDKKLFRQKFNTLFSVLDVNISRMCQYTNYDVSTVFRFRNGTRSPSEPARFATSIAEYIAQELNSKEKIYIIAELIGCNTDEITDHSVRFEKIKSWLLDGKKAEETPLSSFLTKLNEFDLNEYIKAIHFDELKVPSIPFQLPTSKAYFGLKDMMASELDFLKATVLSKSMEPVIMYTDMPMEKMSKDPEFPKKWMLGMAMMLKKGLHLNMIHNIDRPFNEMMLGLESWIPMYMTGQVSPYYLKSEQNDVFLHFLKVSGTVALSGEAISGFHSDGKYYLTKNKDEVAYYKKRANDLLSHANPLMDIYLSENADSLNEFLLNSADKEGKRRNILSAPPLYTMDRAFLETLLDNHGISAPDKQTIIEYYDNQKIILKKILKHSTVEDEMPNITQEEFERYPLVLSLSGMFREQDIVYTYAEYREHIRQTEVFADTHPNYSISKTSSNAFRNLQILINEGQ